MKKNQRIYIVLITLILGFILIFLGILTTNNNSDKSFKIEAVDYNGDIIDEYETTDNIELVEKCLEDYVESSYKQYCFLGIKSSNDGDYNKSGHKDDFIIVADNKKDVNYTSNDYIEETKIDIANSNYNKINIRTATYTIGKEKEYNLDIVFIIYYSVSSKSVGSKLLLHLKDGVNNIKINYLLNNVAFSNELVNKIVNSFYIKEQED